MYDFDSIKKFFPIYQNPQAVQAFLIGLRIFETICLSIPAKELPALAAAFEWAKERSLVSPTNTTVVSTFIDSIQELINGRLTRINAKLEVDDSGASPDHSSIRSGG